MPQLDVYNYSRLALLFLAIIIAFRFHTEKIYRFCKLVNELVK